MPDHLPLTGAGRHRVGSASPMRVDPDALVQVAVRLQERADAMRSAAPLLQDAWAQAALVLAAERTGDVLAETRPGSAVLLEEFASSVELLAQALRRSAQSYAGSESAVCAAVSATTEPTGA